MPFFHAWRTTGPAHCLDTSLWIARSRFASARVSLRASIASVLAHLSLSLRKEDVGKLSNILASPALGRSSTTAQLHHDAMHHTARNHPPRAWSPPSSTAQIGLISACCCPPAHRQLVLHPPLILPLLAAQPSLAPLSALLHPPLHPRTPARKPTQPRAHPSAHPYTYP